MRLELHRGNTSLLSVPLQELLAGTLRRKEQAILLLNRRGLATVVLPRLWHDPAMPVLRYPARLSPGPGTASSVIAATTVRRHGAPAYLQRTTDYFGAGTQRVEGEVRRLFPAARVLRWDQDAVRRAGGSEGLLRQVERGETDVVVGTQMVPRDLISPE